MSKRTRPGGGFGGPGMSGKLPNQNVLMRQFQKMQEDLAAAEEALNTETIEVSSGGGAVKIVINGHQKIQSIAIDREALDTSDEEWVTDLQDLLLAAVNQAVEQSQAFADERRQGITGGLEFMLPPGMGGLF